MDTKLGEIIFVRDFEAHNPDNIVRNIKLLIGKPEFDPTSTDPKLWHCPHQIVGIGNEKTFSIRGLDPLDAMLVSIKIARSNLISYAEIHNIKITWLGEDNLGLPDIPL